MEADPRLFAAEYRLVNAAQPLGQLPSPGLPEVAFAGRSKVGRSSLLNALTGGRVLALAIGAIAGAGFPMPPSAFGSAPRREPSVIAATRQGYRVYRNERFGFSIEYPASFRPSDPPENGDGIGFIPPDGSGDFRAYAGFNALEQTGRQMYDGAAREITEAGGLVTYATLTATGFVASGVIGDKVRYEHIVLSDGRGHRVAPTARADAVVVINSFWAEYPTSRKHEYDPVVAAMSRSLRPGVAAM